MTIDQKVEMFRLRLEGNTLQEIVDRFGITRERVRQILLSAESLRIRTPELYDCVYPNLAKWLRDNRCSYSGFARKVGMSYEQAFYLPEGEDEK